MAEHASGEHATATDASPSTTYGLGTLGWIIYLFMVVMNFFGGMGAFNSAFVVVGYLFFCLVGSYVWIRFLKFVLQKIGLLR